MTFLGKILTVIIFIMSILFMGFSMTVYHTQTVWRDKVKGTDENPGGLEAAKLEAEEEIEGLVGDIEELKQFLAHERAAHTQEIGALHERANFAESQLIAKESQLAELNNVQAEASAALATTHINLERITTEIIDLRDNLREALQSRDHNFHLAVALQDQLHQAEGMRRRLEERRIVLIDDLGRAERVLEAFGMTRFDPIDGIPPRLDGLVTAVNDEQELVEISIGSDEGLRVGHELEVSRGRQYMGRVIIRRTWVDHAVGEIIQNRLQGPMQAGDKVVTKVS